MVSEQIQPLNSLGPVDGKPAGQEEEIIKDPAKRDYKEGRDFLKNGELAQAAICFHNALKGFEEQNDELGIANASDRLGDVCLEKEEYQMAIDHYLRSYAICEKKEDSFSILALNKKLAVCYRRTGQLDKALEVLFDILDHYKMVRNPQGTVQILEVLAEVFMEKGDNSAAADAYRTAASIHANFKHKRLAKEFEERAAQVEQGQG
ncbi:hypothetical protein GF1_23750 [Desulfolithobacter dissulfuricans]|uniref:Tetratricopeptide repeat protein n=1 Tax=Desulfolithobacter dissulfuricans TaxID=2795293 RepID=A0A915U2H1_9BACT|nr:tetratricopeptide repeat protein [Desulfolithobacter dissulfuricans]BCO09999.1 hypothetical protein GF1_23750 [Desulfolithobacter dissulfuricans]